MTADQLLDDRARLMYGVRYDALRATEQGQVMAEVVSGFDPRVVALVDSMERGE